jgi:hypothetical protein
MRLLIRYFDGSTHAAVLMGAIGTRLRVAVPGHDDAIEFRRAGDHWLAENGDPVEIEFHAAPEKFYWYVQQSAERLDVEVLEPWAFHGLRFAPAALVN